MFGSTSFTVAMVLTAVNNVTPILNQINNGLRQMRLEAGRGAESLKAQSEAVRRLNEELQRYQAWQRTGIGLMRAGALLAVPFEESVRRAAQFEYAMKKVQIAAYDAALPLPEQQRQLDELRRLAKDLGTETIYNATEAAKALNTLLRNGMEVEDILLGGGRAAMYLAQTAEIAPEAAADAISQITNMFRLSGRQLMEVADDINRAANASSAGVTDLMHDLQQTGMSAHTLGLKVRDVVAMLGVLHNMGLGMESGTYLNDMLINLDKMTDKARRALYEMGWLKGATVEIGRTGKLKVIGGESILFDEKGNLKSAQHLINALRQLFYENQIDPKELMKEGKPLSEEEIEKYLIARDKVKVLHWLKDVFGIQGMRAAIALAVTGKGSFEDMTEKMKRMQHIQEHLIEMQSTLLGKWEQLKETVATILTQSGTPLTQELGRIVNGVIAVANRISDWANAHPRLVGWILRVIGALAALKIAVGALMWLLGGAGVLGVFRFARGFAEAYRYFRAGTGVLRSLWGAIAFGHPVLTKIGLAVERFGLSLLRLAARALAAAARMAIAWLIGLGPVGWIILGVGAVITGAVVAWKKNLFGFRDAMVAAWNWLKAKSHEAWEGIKGAAAAAMEWLRGLPGQAIEWGRNLISSFTEGIRQKVAVIPEALRGAAEKIKAFLGFSSPTAEGPGRYADRWAPALVDMFARGLLAGRTQVAASAAALAATLAVSPVAAPAASYAVRPVVESPTLAALPAAEYAVRPVVESPALGGLPALEYAVRPVMESPVLGALPAASYAVRPVVESPPAGTVAVPRLGPASAGSIVVHLHLDKLVGTVNVESTGRADYDAGRLVDELGRRARQLVERIGPEVARYLELQEKYRRSRTARGDRGETW